MADADPAGRRIQNGELPFSIESRLLRELGERLVRQPEVALLELVKNAYDADATRCEIRVEGNDAIQIVDDGVGMTLEDFTRGWMRIGTSSKGKRAESPRFGRPITGEKGIGRFAARFLGERLDLVSRSFDRERNATTRLEASFTWADFDQEADLASILVPYVLFEDAKDAPTGTTLLICELKPAAAELDWRALQTGSMGILSPIRSMLDDRSGAVLSAGATTDPGFDLVATSDDEEDFNFADQILGHYAIRATVALTKGRLRIEVFVAGRDKPYLTINDAYDRGVGDVRADLRFFPRREGLFAGSSFDGRRAYTWIRENSGVKVFDRSFQMRPYGMPGDDWLGLTGDAVRSLREPVSPIMQKHYPMEPSVKSSTALNWMLRLPEDRQLIGVVQVSGRREAEGQRTGLIAAADREGFLDNAAFKSLAMLIRGAVEAIAYTDREVTLEEARLAAEEQVARSREATQEAIRDIEADRTLTFAQRNRIVQVLEQSQDREERQRKGAKERDQQLEVMSLLGVVAGFMTHEFGVALSELSAARKELQRLSASVPEFADRVKAFDGHIEALRGFVKYSRAYVEGARAPSGKPYAARPRLMHVTKAFERYADKRDIEVVVDVEADVLAPQVPPSLYDGIAQNLFTNALKALTRSTRTTNRRISFRAWNEGGWHHLQVSDTGAGIPDPIRDLVFDPLFTTTDTRNADPLGSGMGLGLALVRRGAAAFGGSADLANPPPGFTTCVEVKFPRQIKD